MLPVLRAWAFPVVACSVLPVWTCLGRVGPFRAPGLEEEGIHGALLAASIVGRWLTFAALPGNSDVPLGDTPFWPASAMGAALTSVVPVDPGFALGLVVFVSFWLAGFGPLVLVRRTWPTASALAALIAGFAVQTAPSVLRGLPGADLAALGAGPLALGLAFPRLAVFAGLWSVPNAVVFGFAGLARRSGWWLAAALPALALLTPVGPLAGGLRVEAPAVATVPAYLGVGGALFPLPPAESAPFVGEARWLDPAVSALAPPALHPSGDAARPALGNVLVPMQRVHGGIVALAGMLIGAFLARSWAVAAGLSLTTLTLLAGWQLVPGEAAFDPQSAARLAGLLHDVPGGVLSWAAPISLFGAMGLAAGATRLRRAAIVLVPFSLAGIALENPRLALPAVAIPPDAMASSLATLEDGGVIVFPTPEAPWFMGTRSLDRVRWELARSGRRFASQEASAPVLTALLQRTGLPVDTSAAAVVWGHRNAEPFSASRKAGARYLLVHLDGVPPSARPSLDGWLAERVGMPVARVDQSLLYDLAAGPKAALPTLPPPSGVSTPRLPPLPPGVTPLPELPGVRQ